MTRLVAQDVRRVYGAGGRSIVAVEGATFSVPTGRRIAIVGRAAVASRRCCT